MLIPSFLKTKNPKQNPKANFERLEELIHEQAADAAYGTYCRVRIAVQSFLDEEKLVIPPHIVALALAAGYHIQTHVPVGLEDIDQMISLTDTAIYATIFSALDAEKSSQEENE